MKAAICMLVGALCPLAVVVAGPPDDAMAAPAATSAHAAAAEVAPDRKQVSYAIGYRIGSEFADGRPDVDLPTVIKAIRDAHAGHAPTVPFPVMEQQLEALGRQVHRQALEKFQRMAKENAAKSREFMRRNADRPGVVTLPSGVQYRVLAKGDGPSPDTDSTVKINYRGSLINGMEFDSSWAHGKPVTYAVRNMLPGWRDVLPRMHVGARWKVFIPPDQAYGERGQLPRIGPNEALVFDIQLLDVLQ